MIVCGASGRICANQGGTAEAQGFCPGFFAGAKAFLFCPGSPGFRAAFVPGSICADAPPSAGPFADK